MLDSDELDSKISTLKLNSYAELFPEAADDKMYGFTEMRSRQIYSSIVLNLQWFDDHVFFS